MNSKPLQKQVDPFTFKKCVIHIIWQTAQNLKWASFPLSTHVFHCYLPRLGIWKLRHQTCWLSCYKVTQILWFKRNTCRHDFAVESTRRLNTFISLQEESKYWKLLFDLPSPDVSKLGPIGCWDFWGHKLCSVSLRSYLFFLYLWDHIFCFAVFNKRSEPCWENVTCLWSRRGGSLGNAVKASEHRSILLNALLPKEPMAVKMQPLLSVRLRSIQRSIPSASDRRRKQRNPTNK